MPTPLHLEVTMGDHGNPDKPQDTHPGSDRDGQKPPRHGTGEPIPDQGGDGQRPGQ
ncbi:hypothetical protein LG943_18820 [Streptomonospora sp. S1-112]|uniref:Uncharacterized protein n=1 Tax=Streptomonospora mangrovi TaxID=2883123 RepID=A0A9X3SQ41_9ACTN|nr:hypothetical protein [Streptomonospora mangrovi]MDA0566351.1 hypothetical protein [Streptomonospora mangrovi]